AALKKLTFLRLDDSEINDDGAAQIARLTQLEGLSLAGTAITSEGLKHLANLKRLQELDLRRTRVDENAIDALKERLPRLQIARGRRPIFPNPIRPNVDRSAEAGL